MKRFFSVCITIICLSIFWLTSCQNPVADEEVEKASETEQSGVKDSEKTSETEQIYLNNSEIIWKGDLESAPENSEKNWIYYNTTDCNTYIWNAETKVWDILASEDWWQRGFINCNANEHVLSIGFNTWLMGRNGDKNNCTLCVTDNINGFQMIKSFSCNNQSWIGFNYPLTKKGEEYDVTIIVEGTIELRIQDRFKGIAQGGIGYPILKNKDNLQSQYNNKTKVISYNEEPQFDLSNFDGDLLDIGIFYAIYANKAWQDWLIESTP